MQMSWLDVLGEQSICNPCAPSLPRPVISYSFDSCFPGQAQLGLLKSVSWTSSAGFEANKGSAFPVILTHHWHLCMSLLQSRTNTKPASPCALCTKSPQERSEKVGREVWESWVAVCALPGSQIKESAGQACQSFKPDKSTHQAFE